MQSHSTRPLLVTMVYSDLLIMLPVQWMRSQLLKDAAQQIQVRETLPAPHICLVKRAGLPLTPAADYFCDMMRSAVMHMGTLAP